MIHGFYSVQYVRKTIAFRGLWRENLDLDCVYYLAGKKTFSMAYNQPLRQNVMLFETARAKSNRDKNYMLSLHCNIPVPEQSI